MAATPRMVRPRRCPGAPWRQTRAILTVQMTWLLALGLLSSPLPIVDWIKSEPFQKVLIATGIAIHSAAVLVDGDIETGPAEAGMLTSGGSTYAGTRITIIDGDTIALPCTVAGAGCAEKIRLVDVDTPETYQPHCEPERIAGLRAKERTAALVRAGRVTVHRQGVDRYGRTLASVDVAQGDLGDILFAEGLALAYSAGSEAKAGRIAHWCGPGKW